MNGIIWLASYPKSGNTWFRVFLCNLLADQNEPVSINRLDSIPMASDRSLLDEYLGIETSDLDCDEIDRLRPELYKLLARHSDAPFFIKIHDAYTSVADDVPMIPQEATAAVIYVIRNPLDVAVSFAHASGCDYDTAIARMSDVSYALNYNLDLLLPQVRQKLLSWSGHVRSWLDLSPLPVCILRYEDMKNRPLETFGRAIQFAGLSFSGEQIARAIAHSSFENLQNQENEAGFKEKAATKSRFFREGKIGTWCRELNSEQTLRVISDHREIMQRFGYLDERENAVCKDDNGDFLC